MLLSYKGLANILKRFNYKLVNIFNNIILIVQGDYKDKEAFRKYILEVSFIFTLNIIIYFLLRYSVLNLVILPRSQWSVLMTGCIIQNSKYKYIKFTKLLIHNSISN